MDNQTRKQGKEYSDNVIGSIKDILNTSYSIVPPGKYAILFS